MTRAVLVEDRTAAFFSRSQMEPESLASHTWPLKVWIMYYTDWHPAAAPA